MTTSLVMITGPAPGAGKTTLANGLCDSMRVAGTAVKLVPEPQWIFEWPEFAEFARKFRERRYPSPTELLSTFDELRRLIPEDTVWIQDWSWIDLAEDLPWALADEQELARFSRTLAQTARTLSPIVLYLTVDPRVAVSRAVAQRGEDWAKKAATDLVNDYVIREPRLLKALEAGNWRIHRLDASESADVVLGNALDALR